MNSMINFNDIWLLIAAMLVLGMQAGFLFLEAGSIRAKNSVNVAQKNLLDLTLCWALFILAGFFIAFGVRSPLFQTVDLQSTLNFIFQLGFCAAAVTIISGAVAERMSFMGYAALACVTSAFLYPIAVWLCWGNLFIPDRPSLLADFGFVDFAGGTVIHALAAAISLAAILQLGPRRDRFDENGKPRNIQGHSPVNAMFGMLILFFCWFGFNAGGLTFTDPRFPAVLLGTALAGSFGGLIATFVGYYYDKGVFNPSRVINGVLGGLVCVTPCAGFVQPYEAVLVGLLGGAIAVAGSHFVLHTLRLDDPLDVIAVHGFSGVMGTLLVAYFLDEASLVNGSRFEQLLIQFLGVAVIVSLAFAVTWVAIKVIRRFIAIRVSDEAEYLGLNYTEHGVSIDTQRLKSALADKKNSPNNFTVGLDIDKSIVDDSSELATSLNELLTQYDVVQKEIAESEERFKHFARTTNDYLWETNSAMVLSYFGGGEEKASQNIIPSIIEHPLLSLFGKETIDWVSQLTNDRLPLNSIRTQVDFGDKKGLRTLDFTGVAYFGEDGSFLGYRGGASDVTEKELAENLAKHLASHDELTGLGNRRALIDLMQNLKPRAQANSTKLLLVLAIDLDGFKEVNDSYGHAVGDELLKLVAERLSSKLRQDDHVFRIGGDEFIAVLNGFEAEITVEEGERLAQRYVDELSAPFIINDVSVTIGASIGISHFPEDSDGLTDLIQMADVAMYSAKALGKGQVAMFNQSMMETATHRRNLESSIYQAFERDEFYMAYQPQYSAQDGELVGMEALIRWQHPERGVISPGIFLPLIERLKLHAQLGEYTLRESCKYAASLGNTNIRMAVNISPTYMLEPQFVLCVTEILEETGLDPRRLEIEVTEEVVISDFDTATATLQQLRKRGITIAVDDFGKGSTSLSYLQKLPIDRIKIDKSFVDNIHTDPRTRDIVNSVIHMSHDLDLVVVAEGVENNEQHAAMNHLHCDELQGYLFNKAMSGDDMRELIATHTDQANKKKSA